MLTRKPTPRLRRQMAGSIFREPLWHGSDRLLTRLVPNAPHASGRAEYGIYVTPRRRYARMYGRYLYAVLADVRSPLVVEGKHEVSPADLTRANVAFLKRLGYDAIVVVPENKTIQEATEVVLFDARQARICDPNTMRPL